jgi:hypothetical protein
MKKLILLSIIMLIFAHLITVYADQESNQPFPKSNLPSLQTKDSEEYCIIDDVIFSGDKRTLISYPPDKLGDVYQVPISVEEIAPYAFYRSLLESIVFRNIWDNDRPLVIGDYAFAESSKLDNIYFPGYIEEFGEHVLSGCPETLSIIVGKNSISHLALMNDNDVNKTQLAVISDELDIYAWISAEWKIKLYPEEMETGSYWVQEGVLFFENELICYPFYKEASTYRVPLNTSAISSPSLLQNKHLQKLFIPAACNTINQSALSQTINSKIEEIIVEDGNSSYQSLSGVLFSKDTSELLCYPSRRICEIYEVPEGVITLRDGCFNNSMISKIVLPDSLLHIEYDVFTESSVVELNIPEHVQELNIESFEFCPNLMKLIIVKDSYAQHWFDDIKDYIDFSSIIYLVE